MYAARVAAAAGGGAVHGAVLVLPARAVGAATLPASVPFGPPPQCKPRACAASFSVSRSPRACVEQPPPPPPPPRQASPPPRAALRRALATAQVFHTPSSARRCGICAIRRHGARPRSARTGRDDCGHGAAAPPPWRVRPPARRTGTMAGMAGQGGVAACAGRASGHDVVPRARRPARGRGRPRRWSRLRGPWSRVGSPGGRWRRGGRERAGSRGDARVGTGGGGRGRVRAVQGFGGA